MLVELKNYLDNLNEQIKNIKIIDIIKANTKEKVIWVVHCPVCGKYILVTEGEKIM